MSSGVNKVILIGHLGRDPEIRYSPNGTAVANLNLATSESWKDKQTGETKSNTEWHRIVMFSKLGEVAGDYLKKGSKIYIEGKLQTKKWHDQKTGVDSYITKIIADSMKMLDKKEVNKDHEPSQTVKQDEEEFFNDDIPF